MHLLKKRRVKEYEVALQQLEKDRVEVAKLNRLVKELKIFTEALKQTQVQLRENFVSAVNIRMAELWSTLYPYRDFIGVQLAVEEGDYVLQLQERSGKWVNVEGVASGGERSIACLALRIAFSLVLAPQLPMLVLDEPTHNLDSKSVEDLAKTLREGMPNLVDQIFLITHDEKLEEAVTGELYRLERNKAEDGPTKVFSISN
jgi:exonuclease SbcC